MCQDPGNVAHSHRILTGSRFTVGSTVQFICNKGYILSGNSLLTCYNRDSAAPKWSERLPKCVRKSHSILSVQLTVKEIARFFARLRCVTAFSDAFSREIRAVQKPWRCLHQYAELWKGLLPSRGDTDLLLSSWIWAAGGGHHLLYPRAPFTVERYSSCLQRWEHQVHFSALPYLCAQRTDLTNHWATVLSLQCPHRSMRMSGG